MVHPAVLPLLGLNNKPVVGRVEPARPKAAEFSWVLSVEPPDVPSGGSGWV